MKNLIIISVFFFFCSCRSHDRMNLSQLNMEEWNKAYQTSVTEMLSKVPDSTKGLKKLKANLSTWKYDKIIDPTGSRKGVGFRTMLLDSIKNCPVFPKRFDFLLVLEDRYMQDEVTGIKWRFLAFKGKSIILFYACIAGNHEEFHTQYCKITNANNSMLYRQIQQLDTHYTFDREGIRHPAPIVTTMRKHQINSKFYLSMNREHLKELYKSVRELFKDIPKIGNNSYYFCKYF